MNPPLDTEIKNGQWMGVTVKSGGAGGMVSLFYRKYWNECRDLIACLWNVKVGNFTLQFFVQFLLPSHPWFFKNSWRKFKFPSKKNQGWLSSKNLAKTAKWSSIFFTIHRQAIWPYFHFSTLISSPFFRLESTVK